MDEERLSLGGARGAPESRTDCKQCDRAYNDPTCINSRRVTNGHRRRCENERERCEKQGYSRPILLSWLSTLALVWIAIARRNGHRLYIVYRSCIQVPILDTVPFPTSSLRLRRRTRRRRIRLLR